MTRHVEREVTHMALQAAVSPWFKSNIWEALEAQARADGWTGLRLRSVHPRTSTTIFRLSEVTEQ